MIVSLVGPMNVYLVAGKWNLIENSLKLLKLVYIFT
jgi:hypothetical protein